MLRKIRIILAALVCTSVTLLFLGVGWRVSVWLSWAAKIQFLPALMSVNIVVLLALILLTLLFGRLYCSVICPLGVMQDFFGWLGKKTKKNRYSYSAGKRWLRYSVLAVFVLCLVLGFAPVTTLLAPYSAYGRVVNSLFKPLYDLLLNSLAHIEAGHDSYMFSEVEIWMRSVTTFVVALLTLLGLGVVAWRNGRTYCNTICPVGTLLSFVSRFSVFKVRFDKEKCKQCSLCEKNCKASAIDYKSRSIDYSRCVVCGDCIDKCKFDALHYEAVIGKKITSDDKQSVTRNEPVDESKRAFLAGAVAVCASAAVAQTKIKVDGGLAVIEDKVAPHRDTPLTPPGSLSLANMGRHCTACQLCVSACPNNVLRPATELTRFMQPEMSYERGWCRPECTRCSEVCPTGAIKKITKEDKTSVHIGHAVWIKENCIPLTNGDECGHCADVCPSWAIHMVEQSAADGKKVKVPAVDKERCIGCGACENLCPARPFSAIYVEGHKRHRIEL